MVAGLAGRMDEGFPDESLRNGASMQKKVLEFISEHQMLERGDRLVVGVSGGADSVCLLRLLHGCREDYGLALFAVHVNHGLRGEEAARDEAFVRELCAQLDIPCHSVHLDIREEAKRLQISEEEAGREWRYRAFLEEAKRQGCTKLAVAHHMDDNAETVLFRMFRGTGVTGLSGIAPVNTICFERMLSLEQRLYSGEIMRAENASQDSSVVTVIRPLLCVTRADIEAYLKEYPSICLVLDLHRDASGDINDQMRTKATVNGQASAQLMLVVGSNGTGLKHPDWQKNLALALKLQVQLERQAPGICRNINLRGQRFNQDESPGALLVEVGAAGNTHREALTAVEVLAQAILDLAHGAQTQ